MALAMASLVHTASSTVLLRVIISPRVTTEFDVRASVSSEGTTPSRSDTEGKKRRIWLLENKIAISGISTQISS